jgi:CDP-glycerol glycerophosphotransferase (TagB/SpsB family)
MILRARHIDSALVRRRHPATRRILVAARTAMEYAVMAPVCRALESDPRLSVYLTTSSNLSVVYREVSLPASMISPSRAALAKFDAYLVADLLWLTLPRGTRRIQMFHGVAGKYGRLYDKPDRPMDEWDRLFFINRLRMRKFFAAGALRPDSKAARLVGMPKTDCLVNGSLKRGQILNSLGLDPARKTVLLAPTWAPYSLMNVMGETLIEELSRAGYLVLVKLHENSLDPLFANSGGVDWKSRLTPLLSRCGGVLATGSDAGPLMAAADVLITDHSSVGFEYMLLDRPVIRIELPELIAKTNISADYVRLMSDGSITAQDPATAVQCVEQALADPKRQSASRKAVSEMLFYRPGTATARAVLEIYEVLELEPPPQTLRQAEEVFERHPYL